MYTSARQRASDMIDVFLGSTTNPEAKRSMIAKLRIAKSMSSTFNWRLTTFKT